MDFSDPRPIVVELGRARRPRSRRRTLVVAVVAALVLLAGLWWALGRSDPASGRLEVGNERGVVSFREHDGRARVTGPAWRRGALDPVVLAATC